jgi:hypothetical protein
MECPLCCNTCDGHSWDYSQHCICQQCGEFVISRNDIDDFLRTPEKRARQDNWKLSCLTKEQTTHRRRPLYLVFGDQPSEAEFEKKCEVIHIRELRHRWPDLVSTRIMRALNNLAHMSEIAGAKLHYTKLPPSLLFSRNASEADFILDTLFQLGFLREYGIRPHCSYYLSAKGWEAVEQNITIRDPSRKAPFVAMWFGGKNQDDQNRMTSLLTDAIIPAVEEAGYLKPIRIDQKPHNEWIMDQIMAAIKEAPFVVADLTNHNQGVYWEAGFARGLGIPVIHCCLDQQGEHTHFDLQQISQVRYSTPDELWHRLRDRIRATIGPGPFAK